MYVYVYICMNACMYYVYVCTTHVFIYTVCILYVCVYVCIYVRVFVRMYVFYMYVCGLKARQRLPI